MGVKYKSDTFNTLDYYMALVNGSDSTGGSIGQMADTLRDFAFGNSMRVRCTFELIRYDCFIILIIMFESVYSNSVSFSG